MEWGILPAVFFLQYGTTFLDFMDFIFVYCAKIRQMNSNEFIQAFCDSGMIDILDEKRAWRLRQRLQEEGFFPKYNEPVTPGQCAFFILSACLLPTFNRGDEKRPGAEFWLAEYHGRLTRETSSSASFWGDMPDPASVVFDPEKTSLTALAEILSNPDRIANIDRVEINMKDVSMTVVNIHKLPIPDEEGKPKGRSVTRHITENFPGLQSGDDGGSTFGEIAGKVAILTRAALHLLASWTKE